ncbi:MAG: hypothetical protein GY759_00155 [Chloroflexi bacterium]|nr:hypothetical protein [Chloroflexota bacterium]
MTTRRPYPVYKDSGIEWLGEIPAGWKLLPLRRVIEKFVDYRGKTPAKVEEGIPLITARNIKNGNIDTRISQEFIPEYLYDGWMVRGFPEIGDVLVTTEAPLGATAQITETNIALAQRIILLKENKNYLDSDYLRYNFLSLSGQGELWSRATGSTAIGIKASKLKAIFVTLPPLPEQRAIAIFLDRETARIDALIAKKQRLIELLQEKRTALISQAVTKGLDPDASIKDSGVEWIGRIPVGWQVRKLRFLIKNGLVNGLFKKKDAFGRGTKLVNVSDLYQEDFLVSHANLDRVDATHDEIGRYSVNEGDIFFVRSSLKLEGVGASVCILEVPELTVFECHVVRARPDRTIIEPMFLTFVLNSSLARQRFIALAETTTMTTISQMKLSSIEIPFPQLTEQREVIRYIESETSKIMGLISNIQTVIEKLQEYRIALISAAVTGKIDVRETV